MVYDELTKFKTTGGSEDLATSGTTEALSAAIALDTDGFADGKANHVLRVRCKTTTLAAGASVRVVLRHCDTEGGTYTEAIGKDVLLAAVIANTEIASLKLPFGLKAFVKLALVPAASMTGALTANAALYIS